MICINVNIPVQEKQLIAPGNWKWEGETSLLEVGTRKPNIFAVFATGQCVITTEHGFAVNV